MTSSKPCVVIAGATGFIGKALARRLRERCHVVGLTRQADGAGLDPGIEWRRCDLFSLLHCEKALQGADYAFYLVHSMLPSAHFTQGLFQDMDLILADNFARAAAQAGAKQIIYLGGLVPDTSRLSIHLRSRLEVEETLGSRRVPVTALRAGLVIGAGGSSYQIMLKLLERLPVIPCPCWARTPSQPIALADAVELLVYCLEHPFPGNRHCDIGCPEILSYRLMLEGAAELLSLKRTFFNVPFHGTFWCRYWLRLVTGAPRELVAPLLESMRHMMIARDTRLQNEAGILPMRFKDAVLRAFEEEKQSPQRPPPAKRFDMRFTQYKVRSVQRMPLPQGRSARWAAEQYSRWVPPPLRPFIKAEVGAEKTVRFMLKFPRVSLLELAFAHERNEAPDRQVFFVTGGLLAHRVDRTTQRPRLEFREALRGACLLVALHDYQPKLPWPLYHLTQALIHRWVIRGFSRHISRNPGLKA